MGPPLELDLNALAHRVVAHLRPPLDIRDDLIQQANVLGLELLNRFQPRIDPDSPPPQMQAERYLYVSLKWQLRAYAGTLRSHLPLGERDRRLVRDYHALLAEGRSMSLEEAAAKLRTRAGRLTRALASANSVLSLDAPHAFSTGGAAAPLAEQVEANEPGPEETVVAGLDGERARARKANLRQAVHDGDRSTTRGRRRQNQRVIYLFLDELPDASAEVIRLSFALPRKERGGLRACRTYGCRVASGHEHSVADLARWFQTDEARVANRVGSALDELGELLSGRDPRRVLQDISAATSGSVET